MSSSFGQVGAGQFETVREFRFVEIDHGLSRTGCVFPGFELIDRLRGLILRM